ncbi:MAG: energy transducer TonB [bacterium]
MIFALQDEPESGRRWAILGLGAVVAVAVWGGGIFAASRYQPDEKPKQVAIVVKLVKPKPKPPEPPPEAPKTEAPPTAPPPPPPPTAPPTAPPTKPPPKKPPPKKKPEPPPPPEPPPATPTTAPPKPAPVQLGMTLNSADDRGAGPPVQIGNRFGGGAGGPAKAPETTPPPGGGPTQEGPAREPVRTQATVKKKVRPEYTRAALRAGIEGKVVVVARIDVEGKVVDVKLIKGLKLWPRRGGRGSRQEVAVLPRHPRWQGHREQQEDRR